MAESMTEFLVRVGVGLFFAGIEPGSQSVPTITPYPGAAWHFNYLDADRMAGILRRHSAKYRNAIPVDVAGQPVRAEDIPSVMGHPGWPQTKAEWQKFPDTHLRRDPEYLEHLRKIGALD